MKTTPARKPRVVNESRKRTAEKTLFGPATRKAFEKVIVAVIKRDEAQSAEFKEFAQEWQAVKRKPAALDHLIDRLMDDPINDLLFELWHLHDPQRNEPRPLAGAQDTKGTPPSKQRTRSDPRKQGRDIQQR
jgi:hypothetical protein